MYIIYIYIYIRNIYIYKNLYKKDYIKTMFYRNPIVLICKTRCFLYKSILSYIKTMVAYIYYSFSFDI